jgi:hypothetical protein
MSRCPRFLVIVGLTSLIARPLFADDPAGSKRTEPPDGFRWIDAQHDGAEWSKVQAALRDELKPDKAVPNTFTYGYKYIARVGVWNNFVLVMVGSRAGKPEWWMTAVGLVVAKDVNFTGILSYDGLYGLFDFNGDGFDDVAIRCKEVDQDDQRKIDTTDSTVLYSLKGGSFVGEVVTAKDRRLKIWSKLCRTSSHNKLCRNVERSDKSQVGVGPKDSGPTPPEP